jgi:fucose 4-O-acetylase-like acetyltransferase
MQNEQIITWIKDLIIGLFIGTAETIKKACGLQILWFLPTLYVVNLLINIYYNMELWKQRTLMTIMVILHPFMDAMPGILKSYILFGTHVVIFIFPFGVLSRIIWLRFNKDDVYGIFALFGMITCISLTVYYNSEVRLGVLGVYGINNLGLMLLHDAIPVLSLFTLLKFSKIFEKFDLLVIIGRHSLTIFLTHQIFMHTISIVSTSIITSINSLSLRIFIDMVIIAIAIILSISLSKIIYSNENLSKIIFPRQLNDWKMLRS